MNAEPSPKTRKILLMISIGICMLIFIDAYIIPTKAKSVEDYAGFSKFGKSNSKTYIANTNKGRHTITKAIYNDLQDGDSLILNSSIITGSVQKIGIKRSQFLQNYQAGYVRTQLGWLFISLNLISLLLFYEFSKKIKEVYTRVRVFIALISIPILYIIFHLGFNIFIN